MPDEADRAQAYDEVIQDRIKSVQRTLCGRYLSSGYCDDCGGEIARERLMSNPTATRCIDCQEEYEWQQKSI